MGLFSPSLLRNQHIYSIPEWKQYTQEAVKKGDCSLLERVRHLNFITWHRDEDLTLLNQLVLLMYSHKALLLSLSLMLTLGCNQMHIFWYMTLFILALTVTFMLMKTISLISEGQDGLKRKTTVFSKFNKNLSESKSTILTA